MTRAAEASMVMPAFHARGVAGARRGSFIVLLPRMSTHQSVMHPENDMVWSKPSIRDYGA
jgi:hypothetical protein